MKITYSISNKVLFTQQVDVFIVFVRQFQTSFFDHCFNDQHCDLLESQFPDIEQFLKKRDFSGKYGEIVSIPLEIQELHTMCILVGLGAKETASTENYRRAFASGIKLAASYKAESVAIALPFTYENELSVKELSAEVLSKETAIIAEMTTYFFCDFFSKSAEHKAEREIANIILITDVTHEHDTQKGMLEGIVIGQAVNRARYFVDMPPSHLTPTIAAKQAENLAKEVGITCTVFDYKDIKNLGMGGLLGVARGSDEEPRFVALEYKPDNAKNKKPILLVGKGITFDSGGLSLKPAVAMETMKDDMSGAAAVMMTIVAAAKLRLPIHVVSLMPLSENMPSGKATKPGDILTFYNGKTAEVKNTDAEGRLVLADALSYGIDQYNPEIVIDIATLTGASAYALGPFYTGLLSEHDDLAEEITEAGAVSGDYMWRLPMGDDYKKAIKSHIADMCNIGNSQVKAGASTAAHFLQHFVGDSVWAHLDIAGTAFDVPGISYYKPGATGAGVRVLVELLKRRSM
jgi:leucyl aminopeptidase